MIGLSETEGQDAVLRTALPRQQRRSLQPTTNESDVRVEALPELEWSIALEPAGASAAETPKDGRRAWIHRGPIDQVLRLYRQACTTAGDVSAPWWLRALDRGDLPSRDAGFAIEDAVSSVLTRRAGWVYVPWTGAGEDGYWEFIPSEPTARHGEPPIPTTVAHTDRHRGWVDVLRAHSRVTPPPLAVAGAHELRVRLSEIEGW